MLFISFHDAVEIIINCLGEVCWINIAFYLGKAFEAVASWTLAVVMALIIIPLGLPAAVIVSWSSWAGASSPAKCLVKALVA